MHTVCLLFLIAKKYSFLKFNYHWLSSELNSGSGSDRSNTNIAEHDSRIGIGVDRAGSIGRLIQPKHGIGIILRITPSVENKNHSVFQ